MIYLTGLGQEVESGHTVVKAPQYTNTAHVETVEVKTLVKVEEEPEPEPKMSIEDIELIAKITMAEAEGECEEGQRLVISTILNRLDSEHFPNTVSEVIYQTNQFECTGNGRADKCYPTDYFCDLVKDELENRTNSEVMFFRANDYSNYGTPMFPVGNHYFSSYD